MNENSLDSGFGTLLRDRRTSRDLTQEQLSFRADLSTRHISFLETGRSRPSRDSVLALAEALELPLRDRNLLLEAAGFAAAYPARELTDPERSHLRSLLSFVLERHEPYPCYVVDRCWNVEFHNEAGGRTLMWLLGEGVDGADADDVNLLRLLFDPEGLRPCTVNFEEVATSLLARLEREAAARPGDAELRALLEELHRQAPAGSLEPGSRDAANLGSGDAPVLPIHLRRDGVDLRLFSMIMAVGTPRDVTVEELRVETFFPADPESEGVLREA